MTLWNGLGVAVGVAILIFAVYAQMKRNKLPVRFRTFDELTVVQGCVIWAWREIPADDPRRKQIAALWFWFPQVMIPIGTRLSAQDLALLAPFIDRIIAGQGPPSLLSAEYEDWRPRVLTAFKARMMAEGLWPPDQRDASAMQS